MLRNNRPYRSVLGRKFLLRVILFSSLITLLSTGVQVGFDYESDVRTLQGELQQIESTYLESLKQSVWVSDTVQINMQLRGMVQLQGIEYAEVSADGARGWQAGANSTSKEIDKRYPLIWNYRGKAVNIGSLHVLGSYAHIYDRLLNRILLILASNAVKTFLVSGFILFLFQILVARHLQSLAVHTLALDSATYRPHTFSGRKGPHDELDNLSHAFNRMSERLVASHERLQRQACIVDRMSDAVVVMRQSGKISDLNPAAVSLFGFEVKDVLNKDWSVLRDPYYREPKLETLLETIGSVGSWHGRLHFYSTHDKAITCEAAVVKLPDDNATEMSLVAVCRDLTERQLIERKLQHAERLESVGKLTGGVAHDFNNLLTVVMTNLELLAERLDKNTKEMDLLLPVLEAAERGRTLTADLLAFSRRQALDPVVVDLNREIPRIMRLLERTLGENYRIETVLGGGLWRTKIDLTRLEAALINLAVNARDAMPTGGRLTIETANAFLDGDYARDHGEVVRGRYVQVTVTDTGVGMSADTQSHAFEPFYTTKSVGRGTGLGLSSVHGFVKQSGGHIKLYSEEGKGTAVKIYLPRTDDELQQAIDGNRSISVEVPGLTVLLVEDNDLVRGATTEALRELGLSVIVAGTVEEAMAAVCSDEHFDLLLSDVVLQGETNGPALARQVLAIRPGIPVLYMSGYSENAIVHNGVLKDGVKVLNKPFRLAQLALAVREAVED